MYVCREGENIGKVLTYEWLQPFLQHRYLCADLIRTLGSFPPTPLFCFYKGGGKSLKKTLDSDDHLYFWDMITEQDSKSIRTFIWITSILRVLINYNREFGQGVKPYDSGLKFMISNS